MTENKNDGTFSTNDENLIAALKAHPNNKQQTSIPIDEVELDKLFDEIEKDFGWLQLIKMACETNGIGNNYFKKKEELKQKYKSLLQDKVGGYTLENI